ncbi:MAG: SMC-Scp complex subunit ScpB [candidate division Zixibacteria bacterium]|nr:SMC-Scp complex subunit ScpB [candidate division Zixibacteria bacterium]
MENGYQQSVVEALILASPEPLPVRRIAGLIDDMTPSRVNKIVADLNNRYMQSGSCSRIREIAGGFQFYILPEFAGFVEELFARRRKMRLTRASLETLAITAYRQPVTKAEIEHIRGVASDGVLHNLLDKKMITIKGRAETVGRPLQYGTTDEFLKFFGLARLDDLPKMTEIEELIRAVEPQDQSQLSLDPDALDAETQQKLNVADGTFDPKSRRETEIAPISVKETSVEPSEEEISVEATSVEEETSEGITVDMIVTADSTS